jgi:hypothetical protein
MLVVLAGGASVSMCAGWRTVLALPASSALSERLPDFVTDVWQQCLLDVMMPAWLCVFSILRILHDYMRQHTGHTPAAEAASTRGPTAGCDA